MLSPSFLPAGGLTFANMATFQAFTPQALPVVKMRNHPSGLFFSETSLCSSVDEELKIFLGKRKQKKGQGRSHDGRWGQVFAQAQLGFWWGLFPVRPGKCGPQLSRVIKATTCSSLMASLCFLAPSSCSSIHTICHGEVNTHDTKRLVRQTDFVLHSVFFFYLQLLS